MLVGRLGVKLWEYSWSGWVGKAPYPSQSGRYAPNDSLQSSKSRNTSYTLPSEAPLVRRLTETERSMAQRVNKKITNTSVVYDCDAQQ